MRLIDTNVLTDNLRRSRYGERSVFIIAMLEALRGVSLGKSEEGKKLLGEDFDVFEVDSRVIMSYCSLYISLRQKGALISRRSAHSRQP